MIKGRPSLLLSAHIVKHFQAKNKKSSVFKPKFVSFGG